MTTDTGGCAFPTANGGSTDDGMTLRDYFAAKVMGSVVALLRDDEAAVDATAAAAEAAHLCYFFADAMLKERQQ